MILVKVSYTADYLEFLEVSMSGNPGMVSSICKLGGLNKFQIKMFI